MTDELFYFIVGVIALALFLMLVWVTAYVAGHGLYSSKREHIKRVIGIASNSEDTHE